MGHPALHPPLRLNPISVLAVPRHAGSPLALPPREALAEESPKTESVRGCWCLIPTWSKAFCPSRSGSRTCIFLLGSEQGQRGRGGMSASSVAGAVWLVGGWGSPSPESRCLLFAGESKGEREPQRSETSSTSPHFPALGKDGCSQRVSFS